MPALARRRSSARPSAAKRPSPSAHASSRSTPVRVPRGGYWRVSLCVGGNRWRKLNWIGSHFEADHLADTYRRKCHRVAVHRDGQPPRERSALVLPSSYRPPARDPERDVSAIPELLAAFVRSNDKASAIVLTDALLENGFDWAAYDLRDAIARGCRERRGLANRILSEVLNDSVVLDHGMWNFRSRLGRFGARGDADESHPYVLILERTPVYFRGGTRSGTTRKREPRIMLWARSGIGRNCSWDLFGSYGQSEFTSIEDAETTARADIAHEKRRRDPE